MGTLDDVEHLQFAAGGHVSTVAADRLDQAWRCIGSAPDEESLLGIVELHHKNLDASREDAEVVQATNWQEIAGKASVAQLFFREVAHAVPLDQVEELFGEIFGVIAGAFESLRHQQDVGTALNLLFGRFLKVPAEQ